MKRLRLPFLAFVCAAAIQGTLLAAGIVINDTPSLPEGFYQKTPRPAGKGSLVLFRLPPGELSARPYARGTLLKQIVAVGGDHVSIDAAGVRVNGRFLANSVQLPIDRNGQPLPRLTLTDHTLGEDEILPMSTYNPRSFDARYFGPVKRGSIIAVVEPRLTWRTAMQTRLSCADSRRPMRSTGPGLAAKPLARRKDLSCQISGFPWRKYQK